MRSFRSGLGGDFDRLWLAQLVSGCGSQVTYLAVPLTAALVLGASPAQMGLLGAVEQLPGLLVSLSAGVWADRLPRRALLIATDLGRAALVATIPAAALAGWLGMPWLYAVGFAAGALAVVGGVAGGALLPTLVPRERLVAANARLAAADSVVGVAGPALGGALVQALTAPVALLVDAGSFVASALLLRGLRSEPARAGAPRGGTRDALAGLRIVATDRLLCHLCALMVLRMLFGAAAGAPYLLYVTRDLGVAPSAVGLIWSLGSAGLVVGALAPTALAERVGVGRTLAVGLLFLGAADALIVGAPAATWATVPVLVAGQVCVGVGAQLFGVMEAAISQAVVPAPLRGRVAGASALAVGLGTTGGLLVGGALAEALGLRPALTLVAAGQCLLGLFALHSPVGRLRAPPAPEAGWLVLLIGGSSGVGKTTVAARLARRLGVAWLMVDDLRLALERSGVAIPDSARVEGVDAPGGLVAVGAAVSSAIEVVIENHVDQRVPVVIEGDGILPSLLERESVRARVAGGRVRAVFLDEPDPDALLANLVARGADGWRDDLAWYARRSARHGKWLRAEAERRGLPVLAARPRETLAARILAAAGPPRSIDEPDRLQ